MTDTDLIAGLLVREFRQATAGTPPMRVLAPTSIASLVAGLVVKREGADLAIAGGFSSLDCAPTPSLSLGESSLGVESSARGPLSDTFAVLARGWVGVAVTPAQLDGQARTNLSFAGGSHDQPKVALPGSRGLPENNASTSRVWYVVPRHSARVLVEEVDFVSGATPGSDTERALITDLGRFEFDGRAWAAATLHGGVTEEQVAESTGFAIDCTTATTTKPLSDEERAALAEVDPHDLRRLEAAPDVTEMAARIAAERAG